MPTRSRLSCTALVLVTACTGASPPDPAARATVISRPTGAELAVSLGVTPRAIDPRGVPRLVDAARLPVVTAATPLAAARAYVTQLAPIWGVASAELPGLEPAGEIRVRGGTIVRLRQVIDALPVHGGELRVLIGDGGELRTTSGTLYATHRARAARRFAIDEPSAIARAIDHAYGGTFPPGALTVHRTRSDGRHLRTGRAGTTDVQLATATRAWIAHEEALVPAWIVEAYASAAHASSVDGDAFRTVIAADGRVLSQHSLVADAAFSYRVFADPAGDHHPHDGPIRNSTPHAAGSAPGSYPAYEAPQLVTVDGIDPWLATGRTETLGNNVEAYADVAAPTGLTFGDFRATTTAAGVFDRAYDTAQGPLASQDQQMAAVTSLFFVINWLHDFWYEAGFTEAAGNAQDSNYGRGGEDRDAMLAEAQDNALGGARNNANMSTPSDGLPPRMQIYVWSGRDGRSLQLQPSGRMPAIGVAGFGAQGFDVTAEVVLAIDDGGLNVNDACTALANVVTGKIVLADRGNCTYETKTLNVETAGGVGLIVANHTASTSPPSLGDDDTITTPIAIGAVSILQSEGALLKTELAAGSVTATLHRDLARDVDGSLDATLIAHEFGHYLHHRLSACDTRMCSALSEGWGDFLALLVTARDGDDLTGAFPITVYASQSLSSDPAYFGIRRAPYSVDPAINALSFRHMSDDAVEPDGHPWRSQGENAEVHNAGEVWASVLWEGYVALQLAGASFTEVRATMAAYVVAGLLLAPVDASPTETRDAILAAARADDLAAHDLLADAFARRGFGSCAVSPPPSSLDFTEIVESTARGGSVIPGALELELVTRCDDDDVLDGGETARITVPIMNRGTAPIGHAVVTLHSTTPGIIVRTPPVELFALPPDGTADVAIEIALDPSVATPLIGEFGLVIDAAESACGASVTVPASVRLNVDDVNATAASDTFDTAGSVWTASTASWIHVRESALDGLWRGTAAASRHDTSLTSPPLAASDTEPVTLTFTHRHVFEADADTAWDGGVIELSTDGGATWQDLSTWVAPGYTGTLTDTSSNPLGGRLAFTGTSPGYPATSTVTLALGTQLAGLTFQLRFRIGTDQGTGAMGWELDDVGLTGLVGTPFPSQATDRTACSVDPDPGPDDDLEPIEPIGCCDAGPLAPGSGLTALGVLALLRRRRRS